MGTVLGRLACRFYFRNRQITPMVWAASAEIRKTRNSRSKPENPKPSSPVRSRRHPQDLTHPHLPMPVYYRGRNNYSNLIFPYGPCIIILKQPLVFPSGPFILLYYKNSPQNPMSFFPGTSSMRHLGGCRGLDPSRSPKAAETPALRLWRGFGSRPPRVPLSS